MTLLEGGDSSVLPAVSSNVREVNTPKGVDM